MSSPYINHFLQPDTITPGGPQGLNRYSYVTNRPVNFNDPTGHMRSDEGGGGCNTPLECGLGGSGGSGGGGGNYCSTHPGACGGDKGDNNGDKNENEKLWPDDWFHGVCTYTSSCVGQYVKYYTFSFGTAIPNPITGTVVGWHLTITLDQYKDWFFGLGLDAGKNVLGVSASLVEGRFAKDQLPENDVEERNFLKNFLTADSFQGFLVPIVYIGGNYSPSVKEATLEDGLGVPQGGAGWTHSWLIK